MSATPISFADLLASFLRIRADFGEEMERFRKEGAFDFARIDRMEVALYHMKNGAHRLARGTGGDRPAGVGPVELFDLLVGSAFHEMLHLKEYVYTLSSYGPVYEALTREGASGGTAGLEPDLATLFQEILEEARKGLPRKAGEIERLVRNASIQVERIVRASGEDGRTSRILYCASEDLDRIHGKDGLATCFSRVYPGGAAEGFFRVGSGFAASGFVVEAVEAFRRAVEAIPSSRKASEEVRRLVLPLRERLEKIRSRWPGTVGAEAVLAGWERRALPLLAGSGRGRGKAREEDIRRKAPTAGRERGKIS